MITKILKPFTSGRAVFHNKGSCAKLLKYLDHEAKTFGERATYFNPSREGIGADEVGTSIDGHAKGVRATAAKFYSLVISPSAAELQHLDLNSGAAEGGLEKLKNYTRRVMDNYAGSFKLADGTTLKGEDLVWYATFHHGRRHKGTDQAVQEGLVRPGQRKEGQQTHVHVVVARLDAHRQFSLSPTGAGATFSLEDWQRQNAEAFNRMFSYGKQTYFSREALKEAQLRERLAKLIQRRETDPAYLQVDRVVGLAKEARFNWKFYRNLSVLENALAKGLHPPDPYVMFQTPSPHRQRDINGSRAGSTQIEPKLLPLTSRSDANQDKDKTLRTNQENNASSSRVAHQAAVEGIREQARGDVSRSLAAFADLMRSVASTASVPGVDTSWAAFPQQKKRRAQSQSIEPPL